MDVSFVIPTHKTSQFHLLRALNSIEKCLGSSLNGEVIVVLDRSNLQSDFLAYVERKFERERLSIKYFQSQMPGVSAARNLGKEMAKGKFLVFLDSDDTIKPKSFEPVLNYFETTERLWLVGAWHLSFEKCLQVKLPHPLSYSHLLRLPSGPEDLFMMWESKLLWPIHAVIMKNEDLPDFPEGLEEMEDLVFWIAMIEKFGKPAISGRMLASYSRHPAQKTHGSRSPAAILSAFRAANLRSVSNVQLRRKLTFGGSFHSLTGEALVAPRIGRTRP
jgi:glycosyltransferase involved in cell wall biosynthesis